MTRATLMGVPLDLLTMEQTVLRCEQLIAAEEAVQHVVVNAGKYVLMRDQPRLREIVSRCALINADGMSVVWAGRLLGHAVPERVTGIDLMARLLELAESRQWPVFFLGARGDVLGQFVEIVTDRYPLLEVAGYRDGYFEDDASVAELIRRSGARMLFIGMPSPRKEYFTDEQLCRMGPVFVMGVGGTFDVWAGRTRRAPAWMQRVGLEWLYRFAQEPRRMWRRYLFGNARFLGMVASERMRHVRSD